MNEASASGEWVLVWLSPFAHFLLDVVFAVFVIALAGFLVWFLRRARRTDSHSTS
jgi:chromate transport protein ChrA